MTSRINAMLSAMLYCKVASSAGLLVRPAMNQTLLESLRQTIAYARRAQHACQPMHQACGMPTACPAEPPDTSEV